AWRDACRLTGIGHPRHSAVCVCVHARGDDRDRVRDGARAAATGGVARRLAGTGGGRAAVYQSFFRDECRAPRDVRPGVGLLSAAQELYADTSRWAGQVLEAGRIRTDAIDGTSASPRTLPAAGVVSVHGFS